MGSSNPSDEVLSPRGVFLHSSLPKAIIALEKLTHKTKLPCNPYDSTGFVCLFLSSSLSHFCFLLVLLWWFSLSVDEISEKAFWRSYADR